MVSKVMKDLQEQLTAEGYTADEQILGAYTAEFKAGLALLASQPNPTTMLCMLTLSATMSKVLAHATKDVKTAKRVTQVSDRIAAAVRGEEKGDDFCGAPDCEGGHAGEQSDLPAGVVALESFRRPTEAKDIN
jgi:hypothetical protein